MWDSVDTTLEQTLSCHMEYVSIVGYARTDVIDFEHVHPCCVQLMYLVY
jgi:hypothetical protein